ncbi:hypothetical protein FPE01S_01_07060 [Flavihumibacter petaseus NBRC 106054]|uniref:Uncharacterized protein n=2 Tax=Flavihumibacter TaxID=1004301 RepID=A0A0E9MVA6_9BACT|nr:hypothetical protein FPE01S_01_07060 [Flavihumibacter petaseus NBRC 106054]
MLTALPAQAQVNTVEFGKNRVQYQKFKWQFYQTVNFNTYFYQHGEPLAKTVAQMAEAELPELETFMEYGLQRRANLILYNSFNELQQTNIGLTTDWQTNGGNTKLVNNKMVVYFNSNHENLRIQVRQGIAKILLDNILFGDDLGEFATNQALLDLPKWLTDGFVSYAAENWSTELDDQLKSAVLAGTYKDFRQFAFDRPGLAGHAFWRYIEEVYKKENTKYFLYLARLYRNLNGASNRICKKKFRDVLEDAMAYYEDKYYKDIKSRRNNPKGSMSVVEETSKYKDFYNFSPNPAPRSQSYAVVEWKKGLQCVIYYEDYTTKKVLLRNDIRSLDAKQDPHYPLLAWNGKGNKLLVVYNHEGKIRMFTYDIFSRLKKDKLTLEFDQIQDVKFMTDDNTLLMSAVKNGQSDIYTFKIDRERAEQITNDIYDDLDPSFAAFPNKMGILYASNRPSAAAGTGDTILPSNNRFNIFLVDNFNKSEFRQISQLSRLKYGNARYPTQYNTSHFTFAADENGINNRFAGFFTTSRVGVDTIYQIGDDVLRNPEYKDIDSLLRFYGKQEPDTIFTFAITNDSAYVFPITNYQSGLVETKSAGDKDQVSEVRQEGELKFLYKLKVDEATLRKRNVNPRPTDFRRRTMDQMRVQAGDALKYQQGRPPVSDTSKKQNAFESEFSAEKADSALTDLINSGKKEVETPSVLNKAGRFNYRLKFAVEQVTGSLFNNDVLITRYETFNGSLPVTNSSNNGFNGMLKVTVYDLLEDLRFTGMVRAPLINTAGQGVPVYVGDPNVFIPGSQSLFNSGSEYMARFDYLKKRIDYTALYYRRTDVGTTIYKSSMLVPAKMYTNLFQAGIRYPFDRIRSVRINAGLRNDKMVTKSIFIPGDNGDIINTPDAKKSYGLLRLEYVYDNSIEKSTNIWNGLRYKIYADYNSQINKSKEEGGRTGFNLGFDARYYYPIFRNFIWAARVAGDASWGDQKIVYYLGGQDGWLFPKANYENVPSPQDYSFQALAVNLRGHKQNVSNGNNAMVINSEFRFPVFTTLLKRPINNAFVRNFQLTQFIDLGSAWDGSPKSMQRPEVVYTEGDVRVKIKAGGIGPFVGGYGFGARSTLLGYFMRLDTAWDMSGFFKGKPIWYFALGVDF